MCICTVLAYSICLLYDGTVIIYLLCNGLKVIYNVLSWYYVSFCMTKIYWQIKIVDLCVRGLVEEGWCRTLRREKFYFFICLRNSHSPGLILSQYSASLQVAF